MPELLASAKIRNEYALGIALQPIFGRAHTQVSSGSHLWHGPRPRRFMCFFGIPAPCHSAAFRREVAAASRSPSRIVFHSAMHCPEGRVNGIGAFLLIKGLSLVHYEDHLSSIPIDRLAAPRHILLQSYRRRLEERDNTEDMTQVTRPSLPSRACPSSSGATFVHEVGIPDLHSNRAKCQVPILLVQLRLDRSYMAVRQPPAVASFVCIMCRPRFSR